MERMLVVRADAGPGIGIGHLLRTMAIIEAWRDVGGSAEFVVARGHHVIEGRSAKEGVGVRAIDAAPGSRDDIDATIAATKEANGLLVLDGYVFGTDFHDAARAAGVPCAVVDDHVRLDRYACDVVVDPNVVATARAYQERAPHSRVLAGREYALLRREFRLSPRRDWSERVANVLVSFGGADEERLTEMVVAVMASMRLEANVRVIVGAANSRRSEIERASKSLSRAEVIVDATNMAELMEAADIAISAAGTTCSELAYMGVPALLVVTADNQRPVSEGFSALGTALTLGDADDVTQTTVVAAVERLVSDARRRRSMSKSGRAAIDGLGAVRVATALREVIS